MESRTSSRAGSSRTRRAGTGGASEDIVGKAEDRGSQPGTAESLGGATTAPGRAETGGPQGRGRSAGLVSSIKERATTQLATQKDRATEGIDTLAHAVRQTTDRLRDEQHETAAQYVERAAEQLERLSTGLRQKDVNELLQDAQRLARRRPALLIGGSFAAGLLVARFLKSSRESRPGEYGWAEPGTTSGVQASDLPGAY